MKISQRWLRDFVEVSWTPQQFTDELTMVGLEVEAFEDQAALYDKFVVGLVADKQKHPNADKLSVCKVDVGGGQVLQIVCGAPNVAAGQKVAVGLIGATVPHNQHDPEGKPFVLGKVKLRGVESSGMICSAHELGLGDDAGGIIVLDPSAVVGQPLAEYLGRTDTIYEVGITPNRPDCLSHLGVAREVSMLTGHPVKMPASTPVEKGSAASALARIDIQAADLCPRYCARVVSGVKVQPSPVWLQQRLEAVGVRPINVVVDVTNYVMMALGQPLHAFDLMKLAGRRIIVRRAGSDATFTTLDGKKRDLKPDMLMICDAERAVAVAGVMGGENSEISDATTEILIESAYFTPSSVRRTARSLGLSTEASYRFERGADPGMAPIAADLAARMLQELIGATVHAGILDAMPAPLTPPSISLRVKRTNELLGTTLTQEQMASFLGRVGIRVLRNEAGVLHTEVPSHRVDIRQEIDLVEEVARVWGYDNIETLTRAAIDFSVASQGRSATDAIRSSLIGGGFQEVLSLSLQQENVASVDGRTAVKVLNPVSVEMQALRTSLVPGILDAIRYNQNRGAKLFRLFEIGRVFARSDGNPNDLGSYGEQDRLLVALSGDALPVAFDRKARSADLFDLKGEMEKLLGGLYLDKYRFIQYDGRNTLTDPTMAVEINGTYAGWFGQVRKEVAERFEIGSTVLVGELLVSVLEEHWVRERKFTPLPKFPGVTRDLAFVVDGSVTNGDLEHGIREAAGPLLISVALFDLYEGAQAGSGKKSLAYTLTFRSGDHTLTDKEVDDRIRAVVDRARTAFNAELRA